MAPKERDRSSKSRKSSSSKSSSQYPAEWSKWEWSPEHQCQYRWRLNVEGIYDYEYGEKQESSQPSSIVPRSDVPLDSIPETPSPPRYASRSSSNYTTDRVDSLTQTLAETMLDPTPKVQANITARNPGTKVEKFDKNYKVHGQHEFRFGKIFKVLWSEPRGMGQESGATHTSYRRGKYGEEFFEKVRRFVIISERKGHSICLPIMSYGNRGTTKPGVHAGDHAIIYTSSDPVWMAGETGMTKAPIKVVPNGPQHKLDSTSRLNYAKVYTVECNVKVWFIGRVHQDWEWYLSAGYNEAHPPLQNIPRPPGFASVTTSAGISNLALSNAGYSQPGSSGSTSHYTSQYSQPYTPAEFQAPTPSYAPVVSSVPAAQSFQTGTFPAVATSSYGPVQSSSYPLASSHPQQYQSSAQPDSSYAPSSSEEPLYEDDIYGAND